MHITDINITSLAYSLLKKTGGINGDYAFKDKVKLNRFCTQCKVNAYYIS